MSRFYNEIMQRGSVVSEDLFEDEDAYKMVMEQLNDAVVVDITNVADYWAYNKGAEWTKSSELQNIAPSFRSAFYEYRWPKTGTALDNEMLSVGALVGFDEVSDEEKDIANLEDYRWREHWLPFIKLRGRSLPEGPLFWNILPVAADGSPAKMKQQEEPGIPWGMVTPRNPEMFEHISTMRRFYFAPVLLAMCFLNCKNVRVENNLPDRAERRRATREGREAITYKTLSIEPMKTVLENEGEVSKNGLKKALHICRGHFATYTPEKPRFGRDVGTFWISPHVRGSKKQGEVIKDYSVKAPVK